MHICSQGWLIINKTTQMLRRQTHGAALAPEAHAGSTALEGLALQKRLFWALGHPVTDTRTLASVSVLFCLDEDVSPEAPLCLLLPPSQCQYHVLLIVQIQVNQLTHCFVSSTVNCSILGSAGFSVLKVLNVLYNLAQITPIWLFNISFPAIVTLKSLHNVGYSNLIVNKFKTFRSGFELCLSKTQQRWDR